MSQFKFVVDKQIYCWFFCRFLSTSAAQKLNKLSFQAHEINMYYSENGEISVVYLADGFLTILISCYIHQPSLITICSVGIYSCKTHLLF